MSMMATVAAVNFKSPQEAARDDEIFIKIILCLLGLYVWELFLTSSFELSLLQGKRSFRMPWVFYFLARYAMLAAVIGSVIALTAFSPVNCAALYRFNLWASATAIASSATSLAFKTWSLGERSRALAIPLAILSTTHWALLCASISALTAAWDIPSAACIVTINTTTIFKLALFYSVFFNAFLLFVTCIVLMRKDDLDLKNVLFRQGLIYYVPPVLASIAPAVLSALQLNDTMEFITIAPSAVVATISACQAVVRLSDCTTGDVSVQTSSANGRTHGLTSRKSRQNIRFNVAPRPEVHITTVTDQYAMDHMEDSPTPNSSKRLEAIQDESMNDLPYDGRTIRFDGQAM